MSYSTPIEAKSAHAPTSPVATPATAPPPPPGRVGSGVPDPDGSPPRNLRPPPDLADIGIPATESAKAEAPPSGPKSADAPATEPAPGPASRPAPEPVGSDGRAAGAVEAARAADAVEAAGAAGAAEAVSEEEFDALFVRLERNCYIPRPEAVRAFLDENRDLPGLALRAALQVLAQPDVTRVGLELFDHPECDWCLQLYARINIDDFEERNAEFWRIDRDVVLPIVGGACDRLVLSMLHAWGERRAPDTGKPPAGPDLADDEAFDAALDALEENYQVDEPEEVEDYLAENRDLLAVLPRILGQIVAQREVIRVRLSLNVDPECGDSDLEISADTILNSFRRKMDLCSEMSGDIIEPETGKFDYRLSLTF